MILEYKRKATRQELIERIEELEREIERLNSIINTDNIINKERAELIEQQRKELEVLREENFDTVYIQAIADYKSKIKEILKIEGNMDIETYLKIIVAENNRLEDIEDDRDCNYISKDKIRALIEQLEDVLDLAESEKRFPKYRKQALIEEINDLQELLEE